MKRALISSHTFIAAAKKAIRKDAHLIEDIKFVLDILSEDIYDRRLKTHKLKGKLKGSLACSVGYDFRIVFSIIKQGESEAILLETIGTHDEIY